MRPVFHHILHVLAMSSLWLSATGQTLESFGLSSGDQKKINKKIEAAPKISTEPFVTPTIIRADQRNLSSSLRTDGANFEMLVNKGHAGEIENIYLSPDKQRLITTSQDGQIITWDYQTASELHRIGRDKKQVGLYGQNIDIINDSIAVINGLTIRLYNYKTNKVLKSIDETEALISPKRMVVENYDKKVFQVYSTTTFNLEYTIPFPSDAIPNRIDKIISNTGKFLILNYQDQAYKYKYEIINLDNKSTVLRGKGDILGNSNTFFSPNDGFLLAKESFTKIDIYETRQFSRIKSIEVKSGYLKDNVIFGDNDQSFVLNPEIMFGKYDEKNQGQNSMWVNTATWKTTNLPANYSLGGFKVKVFENNIFIYNKSKNQIMLYDMAKSANVWQTKVDTTGWALGAVWNPSSLNVFSGAGRFFIGTKLGAIQEYDLSNGAFVRSIGSTASEPAALVRISKDGKYLGVVYGNNLIGELFNEWRKGIHYLRVIDLSNLNIVAEFSTLMPIGDFDFDNSSKRVAVLYWDYDNFGKKGIRHQEIVIYDIITSSKLNTMKNPLPLLTNLEIPYYEKPAFDRILFSPDDQFIITSGYDSGTYLTYWEITSGQNKRRIESPYTTKVTGKNGFGKEITNEYANAGFSDVMLSSNGKYILALTGVKERVKIWDYATGFLILDALIPEPAPNAVRSTGFRWSANCQYIAVGSPRADFNKIYNLKNPKNYLSAKLENCSEGAFSNDSKYYIFGNKLTHKIGFYNLENGDIAYTSDGHSDFITNIVLSPDGKTMCSASKDGELIIWDFASRSKIGSYFSQGLGQYFFITPDFYFSGTKEALKQSNFGTFKLDGANFPFLESDVFFNQPHVIMERLGYASKKEIDFFRQAREKRLEKLGYAKDAKLSKNYPKVTVAGQQGVYRTDKELFTFTIKASDAAQIIKTIHVLVNGVPIWGVNGKDVAAENKKTVEKKVTLSLSTGNNTIAVYCTNISGISSFAYAFQLRYEAPAPPKPSLHVIAMGVSNYQNAELNLQYPSKDVNDLAQFFKSKNSVYEKVTVQTLLDDQFNEKGFKKLRETLSKTKINDAVVIFWAGHGLLDDNLNYYLATHDVDFNNPAAKGVSYEALEALLDSIPARQKLLLVDACHSGELDKASVALIKEKRTESGEVKFRSFNTRLAPREDGLQNAFELMKQSFVDTRRSNGAIVISSASGVEFAIEGAQWKNSVFTYCLLKGLRDGDADTNKDGKVMVSELETYISAEVPRLTDGRQQPAFRVENIVNDWQVW